MRHASYYRQSMKTPSIRTLVRDLVPSKKARTSKRMKEVQRLREIEKVFIEVLHEPLSGISASRLLDEPRR